MGFRGLKSMNDLYRGGTLNAFGHSNNSATTLTVQLTQDNKVYGIELNTKYFAMTEQIKKFNEVVNFDNPMEIDKAIELAQSINRN